MNIAEMHTWFRQYAQQMGMQYVRGILPEQIDIVINTAITDITNQLVRENVGVSNDRIITDNAKVGQINALRTLYKVKTIDLIGGSAASLPFKYDPANYFNGKYESNDTYSFPDVMFWNDFSINYCKVKTGWTSAETPPVAEDSGNQFITNFYPVRLIEDSYLADTINDFVLKNRLRSPILIIYSTETGGKPKFELYIDKFNKTSGMLENSLAPYKFRMSYISKPAVVKYSEDISGENVDCDLPEYLHVDILKRAVDLYRIAVNGSLHSSQQQSDAQERELYRNNAGGN